ncbi:MULTISPECIES: cytochrome P450 [Protofrankia]|uniref:Cytochrome P450 n=1 Tax=Protofrankia coriariae TaxID=1562887 RepID=A0ABR5F640_9ACTN|nr:MULTISPECIES: cytochrome P450 [Protofrankia]KLL12190.1 cytochrome P450 [Protofrankia coriariae]ONH37474.1 cytochrome [Protofrankia sp. BMG5.30]
MTASSLADIDLADPQTFLDQDLPALWRRLRAESPVHWNPPSGRNPGFWVVSRYADVHAVYKDNRRFTSERGNVLTTLLQGNDSASGKMLAVTDGHRHREIRNLMLKSFSPRALAPVVDRVRARTSRLISEAVERGEFDFATDVADHIPINTIGDLMDVPPADRPKLVDWNNQTLSRHSSQHSELEEFLARNEILLYFSALAQERRRNPGDDVISTLATGEVDGEPLSEDEIVFNCYSLILGADESSRMSSIGGILALARYDGQWRALKDATVSVDTAVEEVLRWTTPAMHFGRRAVVDAQIGDTPVAAGDIVTLWNSSANFDEAVFADSLRFDLARTPNKHVAFGYGPHFCLGAFLGRAHVGAVLHALREQVSGIEVLGEPRRLFSNFVHGYSSVPVRFR